MGFKIENPAANGALQVSQYRNDSKLQHSYNQALSFAAINSLALSEVPVLLRRWLPDGVQHGHEYKARNPRRDDHKAGSFSINVRTGRWADFATGDKGGDVVSLAAYLFGVSQGEALRRVAGMLGVRHE